MECQVVGGRRNMNELGKVLDSSYIFFCTYSVAEEWKFLQGQTGAFACHIMTEYGARLD